MTDGTVPAGLMRGADGRLRCAWHGGLEDYARYHDEEWGRPQGDGRRLFEKLCLEGFQSGLSWLTILRKREAFRRAFAGFEPEAVAAFGAEDVARLLGDAGIVRHRAKIEAAIHNAAIAAAIAASEGSLAGYLWRFRPDPDERPAAFDHASLGGLAATPASIRLASALRQRGWRFLGPTTAYAFMQAVGMVNDHVEGCWIRPEVEKLQQSFTLHG